MEEDIVLSMVLSVDSDGIHWQPLEQDDGQHEQIALLRGPKYPGLVLQVFALKADAPVLRGQIINLPSFREKATVALGDVLLKCLDDNSLANWAED